jgi:predicted acyltransferase
MKERIIALDVLRGFTMIMMIIVNNPGNWSFVFPPLLHSHWNGCTPTDLVFPFFILIVGIAIPMAMPIKKDDAENFMKILIRSLRIFCLGLFYNNFYTIEFFGLTGILLLVTKLILAGLVGYALMGSFNPKAKLYLAFFIFSSFMFLAYSGTTNQEIRIPGVLQRIGIVYFFSSLFYLKSTIKIQTIVILFLLLGYWALMTLVPVPGVGAPNLEIGTNLSGYIDSVFLKNHMYNETKTWDPEGILGTLPAIANGMLGLLIGQLLISKLPKIEILKKTGIIGLILIVAGLLWDLFFPINKSLWSSSFVLYTAGIALLILTVLYYFIEVKNHKKWTNPFVIWGVNPMIVFYLSAIIGGTLEMIVFTNPGKIAEQINLQNYIYTFFISPFFDNPMMASLAGALVYVTIWSIILWFFYKNKLIFKV